MNWVKGDTLINGVLWKGFSVRSDESFWKIPVKNMLSGKRPCRKVLGGDYMIPVSRDEILFRFAEVPAML